MMKKMCLRDVKAHREKHMPVASIYIDSRRLPSHETKYKIHFYHLFSLSNTLTHLHELNSCQYGYSAHPIGNGNYKFQKKEKTHILNCTQMKLYLLFIHNQTPSGLHSFFSFARYFVSSCRRPKRTLSHTCYTSIFHFSASVAI